MHDVQKHLYAIEAYSGQQLAKADGKEKCTLEEIHSLAKRMKERSVDFQRRHYEETEFNLTELFTQLYAKQRREGRAPEIILEHSDPVVVHNDPKAIRRLWLSHVFPFILAHDGHSPNYARITSDEDKVSIELSCPFQVPYSSQTQVGAKKSNYQELHLAKEALRVSDGDLHFRTKDNQTYISVIIPRS